jgi:type II secretory pathway pseudopilin PulG
MGVRSADQRKWVAGVFAVLIPFVLFTAFSTGNGADYQALTSRRAARIQAALEDYKASYGFYPTDLQALVPGELLVIPKPVMFPGENWCYHSAEDSYQLGTYYRRYFSTPFSLRVYAAKGNPPEPDAICQNHLAELKQKYDPPDYPAP